MANHHNDESTDNTTMIPMFGDLDPPDEDAFNQTTARSTVTNAWQLRILAHKWKTLKFTEFAKIDWEQKIDFQKFLAYCTEPEICYLRKYRGKMVPIPCPKHREGTNLMWRQRKLAAEKAEEERFQKEFWENYRAEQKEKAKERARIERLRSQNPDLWRSDKLWLPLGPGLAIIRGDMLADVATFFRDCDITVEIHNEPNDNRSIKGKGEDIAAQAESSEVRPFTRGFVQVRVSIDMFNLPPTEMDLEHPGGGVLRGLKGAHGNAMCGLIVFLGSTGEPASDKIDKECTYWFFCDWGVPAPDFSKIGKNPFRMVRLPNVLRPEVHEIMNRFDLRPGKKRAKSFRYHFNTIVKPWGVTHALWGEFHRWGDLRDVDPESSEEDDLGEDDSSEDGSSDDENPDSTEEDDLGEDGSSEDDSSDDENPQAQLINRRASQTTQGSHDEAMNHMAPAEEAEAGTQSDIGEATNQSSPENDEPPNGSSIASRTRGAFQRRQTANRRRLAYEEPQVIPRKKARTQTLLQHAITNERRRRVRELIEDQDDLIQAQLRDDIYLAPEQEARMETQAPPEEEDEPENEFCVPVAGTKSAIPKHLRGGAKA